MANQSRLISGGVNYYIEGGGEYSGSGTPWTVVTTSPYEIAMNDVAGSTYTPLAAIRQEVYGGGPPFRNGQTLIYDSYGNVTETVTIQCRATSHDNAVTLLQQLRKILNTALFTTPCQLVIQPNGATNAVYFDIYGADVQEDARFINEEAGAVVAGHALLRAVVTWRRSPHGTLITAGETVLNALTFTNTGTGANNNTQAFSAASGDLIYEGQPLNISFKPALVGSTAVTRTYLGSVLNRTYSTTGAGALSTTDPITTPDTLANLATWTMTDKLTNAGIKPRVMLRFSTAPSANLLLALRIRFTPSLSNSVFITPWVQPIAFGASLKLVDMGTFPVEMLRRNGVVTTPSVAVALLGASTDGLSATATLGYSEFIWYYDWCRVDAQFATDGTSQLTVDQFPEATGVPATPWDAPMATASSSTSQYEAFGDVRGRLPRHFSGASLYLAWLNGSGAHTTSHTATVSARVSPQWQSLRGAD